MLGTARTLLTQPGRIAWAVFDPAFYAAANPAAAASDDLLSHYLSAGAAAGCSPNRWFDEAFYRAAHADVAARIEAGDIASGFEHYCQAGYPDRAPHPLFDPAFYQARNPALTDAVLRAAGFANAYDHYLKFGAVEGRPAHPRFDPAFYAAHLPADQAEACRQIGAFQHFLSRWWLAAGAPEPPTAAALPAPARIRLNIDQPRTVDGHAVEPVDGHLDIIGWAAADQPLAGVDVFVDGQPIGRAHHGLRTEGVAAAFPELTQAAAAGFRFVGPLALPAGVHRVRVVASGEDGAEASAAFDIQLRAPLTREGPWSLRRRMRKSEADFKLGLLAQAGVRPAFQIVLHRATEDAAALATTMACLERQTYPHWTLQLGAAAADGWVIRLTAGDQLGVDALLELALHRLTDPAADFIYSDERRIDPTTGELAPFFKPDWSPDLLLSMNYIGGVWAATAGLVGWAGLADDDLASRDGYGLVLRLTERAQRIGHVAKVLCETVAGPADGAAALDHALRQWGLAGSVEAGAVPGTWRVRWALVATPSVSIIILTAGRSGLIEQALHSLRAHTAYPDLEIIVVDTTPDAPAPWKDTARTLADRLAEDGAPFNLSAMNNRAARAARGDVLVFLNDDIRVEGPWLAPLLEQIQRLEVGVVGPLLVYPDGAVQRAGMILTRTGGIHAFHGVRDATGPFGLATVQRNVAAVTGACLMVRRELFERLGGFDERFDLINNDLDFCLRCEAAGLLVVFTPHARLVHHENATRAGLPEAINAALFQDLWRDRLWRGDRWFNPNLAPHASDYRIEAEPVVEAYPARPLAAAASVRRILAIKLDHIGDFILSLPAIRALKRQFPGARLTLLAAPSAVDLAAVEPAIDATIAFEFFHARSVLGPRDHDPDAWRILTERLRRDRFDLAVDLRMQQETRPLLEASGATWLAGFDAECAFPWLDIVAIPEPSQPAQAKRTHVADALLDFVVRIAAHFDTAPPASAAPGPRRPERPCIVLHPGTGNPMRQWPAAYYAELIDRLLAATDGSIILVGSADEAALADLLLSAVARPERVVSKIGLTTQAELAAVLVGCDLFIGNNSGPQHLAASLGVRTIGIHGGVVDAREWGPVGPAAVALQRRMVCSPCYIAAPSGCPREMACLTGLTPARVMATAVSLLAMRPSMMPGFGGGDEIRTHGTA